MKEPISIKEILAVVLKRGMAVIAVTLVMALVLGGLQGIKALNQYRDPDNTAEKVAARNKEALGEYEAKRNIAKQRIETFEHKIEQQLEYDEKSLLMHLNPYEMYQCDVLLSISELDEAAFQEYYKIQTTPVDYIITKIVQQYVVYWNNVDLADVLTENPYPDFEEQYIRELITVSRAEGNILQITVCADSYEAAEAMGRDVYHALLDICPTIQKTTFAHGLTLISNDTKLTVDHDLDRKQITNQENMDENYLNLEKRKKELSSIEKPETEVLVTKGDVVKTAVIWAVLGGLVGFVLACGTIWVVYIVKDGVESSHQAEAILGLPFFGSAEGKRSVFYSLANSFVGERQWKDRDQAVAYIVENLKSRADAPAKVALISSAAVKDTDEGVQLVMKALTEAGYAPSFVPESGRNPAAIAAMRQSDCVILAERLGKANRNAMRYTVEQAKQLDAKLAGFITV